MPKHFAIKIDQLPPGTMACREIGGEQVLLANVAGTIYAVSAQCTHEDSPLCLGRLHGHSVVCSLHGSYFDLRTGRPDGDPADIPLKTYAVVVEADDIYLQLP